MSVVKDDKVEGEYCGKCYEKAKERGEAERRDAEKKRADTKEEVRFAKFRLKHEHDDRKNPGIAVLLSIFLVGAGNLYNGEIAEGLCYIIAYPLLVIIMIYGLMTEQILFMLAGSIGYLTIFIAVIARAYRQSKDINRIVTEREQGKEIMRGKPGIME